MDDVEIRIQVVQWMMVIDRNNYYYYSGADAKEQEKEKEIRGGYC